MRLLLVEDDADLAEAMLTALSDVGFVTDHASSGEDGQYFAETGQYAAMILDIGLPDVDGLTVLTRLRKTGLKTPILLLTARNGWRDRVTGLRAGADDYLGKPFEPEELLARIDALIRRSSGQTDPVIAVDDLHIDLSARSVSRLGRTVSLTASEFRVLACLAVNRGKVLSKIDLAEQMWQEETDRDLNTVEVLIGRLRKKVGASTIQTRRGHGYVIP